MTTQPVLQTLDDTDLRSAEHLTHTYQQMTEQLGRVIVGQNEVLKQVLIALFCQGHCILEGVPGLAKTLDDLHHRPAACRSVSSASSSRRT